MTRRALRADERTYLACARTTRRVGGSRRAAGRRGVEGGLVSSLAAPRVRAGAFAFGFAFAFASAFGSALDSPLASAFGASAFAAGLRAPCFGAASFFCRVPPLFAAP